MSRVRWQAAATIAAWTAVLVASMRWLLDWKPTPTPGLTSALDPVVVTMSVVRGAALALGAYLLAVTALALVVRLLRLPATVVGNAERMAPSALRHLLRTVAGVTMTTVATASPALAATLASPPPAAVRGAEQPADLPSGDEPVVMHRLPDGDEAPAPAPAAAASPEVSPSGAATRVVQPGDHFWNIAEQHLAAARGRTVTDAEIDPFWRAVVAANRHVTPDPDLLVPGQVVQLPAVP